MKLYSKYHLSVFHCASKDETRPNLNGVHLDADGGTWATDGHVLAHFEGPTDSAEDYPQIPGGPEPSNKPVRPVTVPRDTIERVIKAIPKRGSMPALEHAALDTETSDPVTFWTTDLESAQRHAAKPIEDFPVEVSQILADTEGRARTVTLSVKVLEKVLKLAKAACSDRRKEIPLSIYVDPKDPEKAVRIEVSDLDTGKLVILAMPTRV